MLRSLYSGVSGMKSQQVKMDTIGNNIANVNTTAFKSQRVTFKDMLSQTMQSASSPTTTVGGTNPKQVGLGVAIASIDTDMSQGALQPTGRSSDLAIQGNGFFIVTNGIDKYYTRDGSFTLDKNGDLLTSEGLHVVGKSRIDENSKYINIPLERDVVKPISIRETVNSKNVEVFTAKIYGLDSTKLASVSVDNSAVSVTQANLNDVNSNKINMYASVTLDPLTNKYTLNIYSNDAADIGDLEKKVNNCLALVQGLTEEQLKAADTSIQDLRKFIDTGITGISLAGIIPTQNTAQSSSIETQKVKLTSYGIEKNGDIRAIYGEDVFNIGNVKIATFQNPGGLEKKGSNLYLASANSGQPLEGNAADAGYGTIEQGYLEMSKVDLAEQFTEMIITSRAFQANSRTITTSDEMLQELLNLKR